MKKLINAVLESEDHMKIFYENHDKYKPEVATKLQAALDECRINVYYDLEKDYKYIKVVLYCMNHIRKFKRRSLLLFIVGTVTYICKDPILFFKSLFTFKKDAKRAIADYWEVKEYLADYNELEQQVNKILDILENITTISNKKKILESTCG